MYAGSQLSFNGGGGSAPVTWFRLDKYGFNKDKRNMGAVLHVDGHSNLYDTGLPCLMTTGIT